MSEVEAPEVPEVVLEVVPGEVPGVPEVPEVAPAVPVKRPRGRPRKNPELEPKPKPKPRPKPKPKPRVVEPEDFEEEVFDEYPDPHHMPDPVHFLAQMILEGEAEARRRKAERYKNMLGL